MATPQEPSYYDQVTDMGMKHHSKLKEWMASKPDLAAALFMAMAIVIIVQIIFYIGKALIDKLMVHVAPTWWSKFLAKKAAAADAASTAFAQIVAAGKKSGFEDGVHSRDYQDQTGNLIYRGVGRNAAAFQDFGMQAPFAKPDDLSRTTVQLTALPHANIRATEVRADGCPKGMVAFQQTDGSMACITAQDCSEKADDYAYDPLAMEKHDSESYENMIGR
jgi:hypothetical protein